MKNKYLGIFLIALVLGSFLILFNIWNYNRAAKSFEIRYNKNTENALLIEENNPAKISFNVWAPDKIDHIFIEFRFKKANASLVSVYLNSVLIQSIENPDNNSVYKISLGKDLLRRKNDLVLSSKGKCIIGFLKIKQYSFLQKILFLILNLIGLLIFFGPYLVWKYLKFLKIVELEDRFPDFLRDVVEGLKAGMSLPQSVKSTRKIDYGKLTPYIQKIAAQLDWGISFEKALHDFGVKSTSKTLKRAINAIIQTYKSGGKISDVLESIGENLKEIRRLKKERQSELYGEVLTGYIVYITFIIVLIGLMKYLVPALNYSGDLFAIQSGQTTAKTLIYSYRILFRNLIIIQAVFSGLVIGKLSEGKLAAGIKHAVILLIIGYAAAVLLI